MAIEFYRNKGDRMTSYTAVNTDEGKGSPSHKAADLVVEHKEPTHIPHYNPDGTYSLKYLRHMYLNDETLPEKTQKDLSTTLYGRASAQSQFDAYNRLQNDPHIQPDTLFSEEGKHESVVSWMMADPSMRTHALTLGALAHQDNPSTPLVASHDLSAHSSKLMRHLTQAGFPVKANEGNAKMAQTNHLEFTERTMEPYELHHLRWNTEKVSPAEVAQAQSTIRNTIKAGRKKRNTQPTTSKGLSDQFLPGMEGFV